MGEYANELIDNEIGEDGSFGYRGYGYMRRNFHNVPSTVECKQCGKAGLFWQQDDAGAWYLQERDASLHVCDEKRVHRGVQNAFDVEIPE